MPGKSGACDCKILSIAINCRLTVYAATRINSRVQCVLWLGNCFKGAFILADHWHGPSGAKSTRTKYMRTKRIANLLVVMAAAVVAPFPILAETTTVTWDGLPVGVFLTPATPTYDGYNFYFGDSTFGDLGANDGNHGPLQYSIPTTPLLGGDAAYNAWGNTPIRVESIDPTATEAFTFSGWFSSQYNLGPGAPEVEVEGFTGTSATPSFTTTFTMPADGSWVDEDFTADGSYNKFLFSPLDANGDPSTFLNGYIWMDNVTLATAPDAGTTSALLGISLGGMAFLRRKLR